MPEIKMPIMSKTIEISIKENAFLRFETFCIDYLYYFLPIKALPFTTLFELRTKV